MYNTAKNTLIKDSTIQTPKELAEFIYKKINRKPYKNILDIGANDGALSRPFKSKKNISIIGLDINNEYEANFDKFIYKDFLDTSREDYKGLDIDLIISNPPFDKLLSWKFIKHSKELFGDIPMVFIVPEYILNNSKNRAIELEQYNITKIVKLNQNTFENVAIHCSVIFININFKSTKLFEYYYPKREVKGRVRTLYFTKEQEEFLKKNRISNFTKYIKELIKRDNQDFPM